MLDTTQKPNLDINTVTAPAGVFDGEVAGKLSPDNVIDKIGRWR